jgi:hypothetical protein
MIRAPLYLPLSHSFLLSLPPSLSLSLSLPLSLSLLYIFISSKSILEPFSSLQPRRFLRLYNSRLTKRISDYRTG